MHKHYCFYIFLIILIQSCSNNSSQKSNEAKMGFKRVDASSSGIDFINVVEQTEEMNMFTNLNILNGGGVAVGDLNNDGLQDIYFTANQNANKLYLNQGKLKFKDISSLSGVEGNAYWTTGTVIVDINGDGWNDIYVCYAGNYLGEKEKRRNQLFINNADANENDGIPTFTDRAKEFGLDCSERSMQATFFDMDNDNDLDLYLVNHPYNFSLPIDMRLIAEKDLPADATDRLYRNDGNNTFTDITYQSGIANFAFGLSASAGDLNGDGYTDLFVTNDYSEKDAYLINKGNGTFIHGEDDAFFHISNFSMGSDIADFNNDLLPDLFVADMMAEDNRRKKVNMSPMKPEVFWDNVNLGRHYQYMQNVLQLNNGNGTFSDIAELAGVAYTDWSWSPLFADFDNDGWKDLFISNGLPLDFRNADVNKTWNSKHTLELRANYKEELAKIPSEPIANYVFKNDKTLGFSNKVNDWGLSDKGFSSGAAVADLDNDGDLDLVLNNLFGTASLYENLHQGNNYLQLKVNGPRNNTNAVGLTVILYHEGNKQVQQVQPTKGFQSSSGNILHFGLAKSSQVDSMYLTWNHGKIEYLENIKANQQIEIFYKNGINVTNNQPVEESLFKDVTADLNLNTFQVETVFDDYDKELLLPHKYSQMGPFLEVGDLNRDGLEDFMVGGSAGNSAQLFLQSKELGFSLAQSQPWTKHKDQEDMSILFFDADGDQDLDIYIASGSNEWIEGSDNYLDRLYINDGKANFTYEAKALPKNTISSSCVKAGDYDQDGDLDLFVGGRVKPGKYPSPVSSFIYENENGVFSDVTNEIAIDLKSIGMITDASWIDYDSNGSLDLILVGEWMPITVFKNDSGKFKNVSKQVGLADYLGWWYSLESIDYDNDGDLDFIAGNLGLNAKYKASEQEPFQVYYSDFDQNGTNDIVLVYYNEGKAFPVRGKSCSSQQMPEISKQYPTYELFSKATFEEVYQDKLDGALNLKASHMASSIIINNGDGSFKVEELPYEAQLSTVNTIEKLDVDNDGVLDILLAGNMYQTETETQRHDASIGLLLKANSNGTLKPIPPIKSSFFADGDVKDMKVIYCEKLKSNLILIARNNQQLKVLSLNGQSKIDL